MAEYDVGGVLTAFLDGGLQAERAPLVLECGRAVRELAVIPRLAYAVAEDAQGLEPAGVLRCALTYGACVGVFLEKERTQYAGRNPESAARAGYAFRYVIASFLKKECPGQYDVWRELRRELRDQKAALALVCEIADEISAQKADRPNSLRIALMYGMVLGILLERERMARV